LISFPNAKINLGLSITEKRSDGYHNLESCFYPIEWSDILEIVPDDELNFSSSGITIPGNDESNLCLQAYHLLKKDFDIPQVNIHLHKIIPIGAGLGGGSSDGAFALKMLNEIFNLSLSIQQLESYASQLGSDCPFFIKNQAKYVTGTGDEFQTIQIDLSGKHITVIKPNIHISTAEAYAGITPDMPTKNVKDIIENQSMTDWRSILINDFEKSIFPNHTQIAEVKRKFYAKGALYASMTGSGAAVFGIFDSETEFESTDDTIWTSQL